jgi:hypothetical protein
MDWVSVKGFGSGAAKGAGGTAAGAGAVGGEAQENIPGRMTTRTSKSLNGRMFIFTIVIVYNRLENNKSGYGVAI